MKGNIQMIESEFDKLFEKTTQRLDASCWDGFRKQGTKTIKKNGKKKRVNNCVKENSSGEPVNEKNATCTGPTKKASSTSKGKKYMKCVKSGDGYKRIHWGQKGAKASSGNSKRKKAFRARHKCSSAKSNTPRGQACKDW